MAKRRNRKQQDRAAPTPRVAPTVREAMRLPAQRSAVRVAGALRAAASQMPDIVSPPTRQRVRLAPPLASPAPVRAKAAQVVRAATQAKPERPTALETAPVIDAPRKCKARPTQNKGNGGSKSYVPWCEGKSK